MTASPLASSGISADSSPGPSSGPGSRVAALKRLTELVRPVTLAGQRTLPVAEPLAALLPEGALTRGSMVQVAGIGATSLALALISAASQGGSWSAVIGLPELALVAAQEHGIALGRLALIEVPRWRRAAELVAAIIDGIDLVLLDARVPLTAAEVRRVTARLRDQGSVLLMVDPGLPGASTARTATMQSAGGWSPDVVLTSTVSGDRASGWSGLGDGHGVLRCRRVIVDATGRGRSSRPRRLELLLPDAHGAVAHASVARSSITQPSITQPSTTRAPVEASPFHQRGHRVAG